MPPHCDSIDGPVVTAARQALEAGDVDLVLPFVPPDGEQEVREVFHSVLKARDLGPEARETADRLFFETVVRIHRAGEGAPYTGLKPAGLDVGPVIPLAEQAVAKHSPDERVVAATQRDRDTDARAHRPGPPRLPSEHGVQRGGAQRGEARGNVEGLWPRAVHGRREDPRDVQPSAAVVEEQPGSVGEVAGPAGDGETAEHPLVPREAGHQHRTRRPRRPRTVCKQG